MRAGLIYGRPRRGRTDANRIAAMKAEYFKLAAEECANPNPTLTAEIDLLEARIKLEMTKQKGKQ